MAKDNRVNLRISDADKQMVQELAKHLNVKESDVWRIAIKLLHDKELKQPR